ncbi:F-box domain [Arabidopsis thaliana x Arabidopsis arenosa]|uniref:F-box domain n=1 Tax=Arabidopsis thaliana x Arabidopsis arenosa TaxID=1240361 RepID=A0A8T2ARA0_9BRAS|nr:F-box domain [Arabidopsis thaliana x Arabidopsis arenosa]
MSTPENKRKRKRTTTTKKVKKKKQLLSTPQSTLFLSIPYDLLLHIVARVPVLYYPTLSLVSKSFRSLIASPELYKVRSLLGRTESCLYVCLNMVDHFRKGPNWFTLCRKPDKTLTGKERSGYILARVPIPHSPNAEFSSLVAVGSDIYNIGVNQDRFKLTDCSSSVTILDCRSHTWREAPSLPVGLYACSAGVLDGKIYVAGQSPDGYSSYSLTKSVEVFEFDIKTQVWDPVPIPGRETKSPYMGSTACIDGKFNVVALGESVAYDPKEGSWDLGPWLSGHMCSYSYCEIENVLYSAAHGALMWYDSQVKNWRVLKGLVGLPKFPPCAQVRLADYGGKIVAMWDLNAPYGNCSSYKTGIWCAEIALERLNSCEIWGKVEWVDNMLTIFDSFSLVKVIAATV